MDLLQTDSYYGKYKKYKEKYIKLKHNKYGLTLTPDILNTDGYFISMLKKTG